MTYLSSLSSGLPIRSQIPSPERDKTRIAQNIPPFRTLSHENSFSHFTANDDRFSNFDSKFKGSSFDEASGLSLTLPELPGIPRHFAKLLVPLAVFLYRPRSQNQLAFASKPISWLSREVSDFYRWHVIVDRNGKSTRTSEKQAGPNTVEHFWTNKNGHGGQFFLWLRFCEFFLQIQVAKSTFKSHMRPI